MSHPLESIWALRNKPGVTNEEWAKQIVAAVRELPSGDSGDAETARVIIEVTAGVIPGQAMDEYTRRFAITSREWQEAADKDQQVSGSERVNTFLLMARASAEAEAYASILRDPSRLNFVRVDWIWL